VHELRRPRRRPGRPVLALHESDAVAARRRVQRHTGAGDSPADDDQVEALVLERGERVFARDHPRYVT
jgi:hypothetical protein